MSIIQIQHLYKTFGTGENAVHALEDISLDIQKGEIFGIIGLSGAGKSTLVRCMNLLERPTSGTVIVDGKDMTALSEKELRLARRNVTMIFQSFNLLMQRTVLKNVCFPMELSGVPPLPRPESGPWSCWSWWACGRRRMPIPPSSPAGRSSGWPSPGPWPRTPRSCCATRPPPPWIPPPPPPSWRLLKDLNEKLGVTVVVITHQMSVIEEICSRVAILDGGVVAEQGKVEDIFSNPHTDAARRLVYPGGVSLEQYPAGTHAVRVAFNGGTAYQPLIASLAIDLGVKVNILGADTRNIEGRAFGTMLLGLPDDPNEAAKALSYIRAQPNVSAEEVEYHV